jgi:hypothetical protein
MYGAETWTLRKADQKYLGCFEVWCQRRMEKISWTDRVKNEDQSQGVKKHRTYNKAKEGQLDLLLPAYELPSKTRY